MLCPSVLQPCRSCVEDPCARLLCLEAQKSCACRIEKLGSTWPCPAMRDHLRVRTQRYSQDTLTLAAVAASVRTSHIASRICTQKMNRVRCVTRACRVCSPYYDSMIDTSNQKAESPKLNLNRRHLVRSQVLVGRPAAAWVMRRPPHFRDPHKLGDYDHGGPRTPGSMMHDIRYYHTTVYPDRRRTRRVARIVLLSTYCI